MESKYKRDCKHMYFILERQEFYEEDYQMKMMKENRIEGLLQVTGQGINGKSQYNYEISGKVSVKSIYEKMVIEKEELENFLRQFLNLLSQIENYLLNVNCILLEPEYIFYEEGKYFFCYLPIEEEEFCYRFHCLTEYFVSKINHKEQEAILLAYELHKATMEENYSLEKIIEQAMAASVKETKKEREMEEEYEDDWIDFEEQQEKQGNIIEEKWKSWKKKWGRRKTEKWGEWEQD
ncbi:hypothetical protein HMPREF9477_01513 [Lachnospiraceae bacterium 2_1_46FAA]|nr:hypothetical protein HMPREF9477_01513 [Lachnospiraceae bacterium 2_1_46FAA]